MALAEARRIPMVTSRLRSALEEVWMGGAVLMSLLALLGLWSAMPGAGAGVGRPALGAGWPWRWPRVRSPTASTPGRSGTERWERRRDLRRARGGAQHLLTEFV